MVGWAEKLASRVIKVAKPPYPHRPVVRQGLRLPLTQSARYCAAGAAQFKLNIRTVTCEDLSNSAKKMVGLIIDQGCNGHAGEKPQ